jgi:hypothetical protein
MFSSVALRVIQRNDLCSIFSVVDVLDLFLCCQVAFFAPCSNIVIEHLQMVKSFSFIFKNEFFFILSSVSLPCTFLKSKWVAKLVARHGFLLFCDFCMTFYL